jgi:hypothetical protein
MKRLTAVALVSALGSTAAGAVSASGPLSVYAIVERVVFEPNERTPERIQVWGAFAYAHVKFFQRAEGDPTPTVSKAERGYLYFRLPTDGESIKTVRNEWADLKAVAGSGQAVGFGGWGHIGRFEALRPDVKGKAAAVVERSAQGDQYTDLRVRRGSEPASAPVAYQTNAGIVTLSATGSHAAIVQQLKDALQR